MQSYHSMLLTAWVVLAVVLVGMPDRAAGETVYVSEVREISKRAGPSTDHRILRMLPAGAELEALSEQAGWLQVRGSDGLEGWVLQRFTTRDVPLTLRYQELRRKYDALYEASSGALGQLAELEEVNQKLLETLSETSNKLLDLDREYAAFRSDAAEVEDLRLRYAQLTTEMDALLQEATRLREENSMLKSQDRFRWFLVGGSVFFVAWLVGMITGRRQGKRRNTLHYI
ncbi:TIGR04211 family SH3 domain-containing protein [Desulfonatronum thioautotrophicum]|uniref:TIGR04211 family SH3 domain-containing protein n=1 Tax=Desulfonatronum thioautotrophicum TaxID=617001 RepID=UPI0013793272|nr:TIGR04211 family SH3 domain-containing protein [Desulfonatronum thioautotrophicum]